MFTYRPVVVAILIQAALALTALAKSTSYSLLPIQSEGGADLVQVALEAGGDLKLPDGEKPTQNRAKMSVLAKFVYDERRLATPGAPGPTRSVRYYHHAEGAISSGDHQYKPGLRDERRLIAVEVDGRQVTLFSPQGPLGFEELELIDILANSLLLDRMLPAKPVAIGSQWKHPDDLMAAMLGLDAITFNDATSTLVEAANGKATIDIAGRVTGAEDGVASQIELKGRYHFDLEAKRVTWLGLAVREDRAVGHVDTGFDVVARLQMKITPGRQSEHLTDAALAGFSLVPTPELTEVSYEPAGGGWKLGHDRRWFVITEEENRAVLRLIDRGDKLAQCNIALLPALPDAAAVTLEGFQSDVIRSLGDNFKGLLRASQRHSEADYRIFCVIAEGEITGVPMQWNYYLVIDREGRRVVAAFVLEKQMLDRFGQADEGLVATLRLAEPKMAAKPDAELSAERPKR